MLNRHNRNKMVLRIVNNSGNAESITLELVSHVSLIHRFNFSNIKGTTQNSYFRKQLKKL